MGIELVCLDMAGTTVRDDGAVIGAFTHALDRLEVNDETERARMMDYVRETMGMSKIVVFRSLFGEDGRAEKANEAFESAYGKQIAAGKVEPLPGALETIEHLRAQHIKVALLTGFSKQTRDDLVDALGWRSLVDLLVCPEEAGRGRPYPDMVLYALLRLEVDDVASLGVVGDTANDVISGKRSGASLVAGVLTGADDRQRLEQAGATVVLESIANLGGAITQS